MVKDYGLEKYMELLYNDLGYKDELGYKDLTPTVCFNISRDVATNAQTDLTYDGLVGNTFYLEYKYHSKGNVSFAKYAKFAQVLNLLKFLKFPVIYKKELVMNTHFDA